MLQLLYHVWQKLAKTCFCQDGLNTVETAAGRNLPTLQITGICSIHTHKKIAMEMHAYPSLHMKITLSKLHGTGAYRIIGQQINLHLGVRWGIKLYSLTSQVLD